MVDRHAGGATASRRNFLRVTAAAGAVGPMIWVPRASAAPKTLTFLHESSFIRDFDAYFKKKLGPRYEKATGIKIDYELVSVGSLQTRVTTVAETGIGPRHDC